MNGIFWRCAQFPPTVPVLDAELRGGLVLVLVADDDGLTARRRLRVVLGSAWARLLLPAVIDG